MGLGPWGSDDGVRMMGLGFLGWGELWGWGCGAGFMGLGLWAAIMGLGLWGLDYGAGVIGFVLWAWHLVPPSTSSGTLPANTPLGKLRHGANHPPAPLGPWVLFQGCLTSPLHGGSPKHPTTASPHPTCGVYWGQAGGEAQPQAAVVPRVSQHIQGQLRLFLLVHGAVVLGQNVADLARSCHQDLCRETTVSPGPEPTAPAGAPGWGWVRSGSPLPPCAAASRVTSAETPARWPQSLPPRGRGQGGLVLAAAPSPALPVPLTVRGLSVPKHGPCGTLGHQMCPQPRGWAHPLPPAHGAGLLAAPVLQKAHPGDSAARGRKAKSCRSLDKTQGPEGDPSVGLQKGPVAALGQRARGERGPSAHIPDGRGDAEGRERSRGHGAIGEQVPKEKSFGTFCDGTRGAAANPKGGEARGALPGR